MLSMHSEDTWVRQALDAGARGYILKNAVDLDLVNAIKRVVAGEQVLDPGVVESRQPEGRARLRTDDARTGNPAVHRGWQVEQGNRHATRSQCEYRRGASRKYDGRSWHSQDRGTCRLRDPEWAGEHSVNRRSFLSGLIASAIAAKVIPTPAFALPGAAGLGFQFVDVTPEGRHSVPTQHRRLRRQTLAGDHGIRLRFSGLRSRRLAGHSAGQRHGLARPQASAKHAPALPTTIAMARSPM